MVRPVGGARAPPSCLATFFLGPCAISGYETGDPCRGTSFRECVQLILALPCLPLLLPFLLIMFCWPECEIRDTKGGSRTLGAGCDCQKFGHKLEGYQSEPGCCCIRPFEFCRTCKCTEKGRANATCACVLYILFAIPAGCYATFCWKPDPENIIMDGQERYLHRGSVCPFHSNDSHSSFGQCWSACVSVWCCSRPYSDGPDIEAPEKCQCIDGSAYSFPVLNFFSFFCGPCIIAFYERGDLCSITNCDLLAPICFICNFFQFQCMWKANPMTMLRAPHMHGEGIIRPAFPMQHTMPQQ